MGASTTAAGRNKRPLTKRCEPRVVKARAEAAAGNELLNVAASLRTPRPSSVPVSATETPPLVEAPHVYSHLTVTFGLSGEVLCPSAPWPATHQELLVRVTEAMGSVTPSQVLFASVTLASEVSPTPLSWLHVPLRSCTTLQVIRHAGRWSMLQRVRQAAEDEQGTIQSRFLEPLLTRRTEGARSPQESWEMESRGEFQQNFLRAPRFGLGAAPPEFCTDEEAGATEWEPMALDMRILAIIMETAGVNILRLAQAAGPLDLTLHHIFGTATTSYFRRVLRGALSLYPAALVETPPALKALNIGRLLGPESQLFHDQHGRRWCATCPVLQAGLGMNNELGALGLWFYFKLHQFHLRPLHESTAEARQLMRVLEPGGFYLKYLLKPVMARLTFSSGTAVARRLTELFVEMLDDTYTESDLINFLKHFWHLSAQQLTEAVGVAVLKKPAKPLISMWGAAGPRHTTHQVLRSAYCQRSHHTELPWTKFCEMVQAL